MFQVSTGKTVLGYFPDAAILHVGAEQSSQNSADLRLALAAAALNDHHPLSLVAGNQAVADIFLQGWDVLRAEKAIQKLQPEGRLWGVGVVGHGETVADDFRLSLRKGPIQKKRPIGKVNPVRLRGKILCQCRQLHQLHNVADFAGNVADRTVFQLFKNLSPQGQLISHTAFGREKSPVCEDDLVQPFLQTGNQAILVQHFNNFHPLFQLSGNEQIRQILHIVQHLTGFHKPIIQSIFRCLGCVLHLPAFQQMQIITQHSQAAYFLLPVCFQQGTLRFGQGSCHRRLVRANPKILCQLLRCLVTAQGKQPRHKVNHIAGGPAAEAVKIPFVQLHAGVPVLMERAAAYPVSVDLQPIVFRCILHTNILFYQFKQCHQKSLRFRA